MGEGIARALQKHLHRFESDFDLGVSKLEVSVLGAQTDLNSVGIVMSDRVRCLMPPQND